VRQIIVKYQGKCSRCGKTIEIGSQAMYEKTTGIFCIGCEPTKTEDIRHFRKIKAQKKAEKLYNRAERLKKEAEGKMREFNTLRKDYAWVTQPGHVPGRQKVVDRYNKGSEMLSEAKKLEERAENVKKVRVKGDAKRSYQKKREANDKIISIGDKVKDFCFGIGEVKRINKKTYTIQFEHFKTTRDKTFVTKTFFGEVQNVFENKSKRLY